MPSHKLRRPKEPEASKEEFYRAALELFAEKGYYAVSINDVIARTKRSKGGFYHHFKSKDELFLEVFHKLMQDMTTNVMAALARKGSVEEAFTAMFSDKFVKGFAKNRNYMKAVVELYFLALRDPKILKVLNTFHGKVGELIAQLLEAGRRNGELKFSGPARDLASMIYDGNRGIMFMEIILNNGRDLMPKIRRHMMYELKSLKKI